MALRQYVLSPPSELVGLLAARGETLSTLGRVFVRCVFAAIAERVAPGDRCDARCGAIIFVHDGWCKGCGICVDVCPKQVLGLDGRDKPVLLDEEHCTGCLRCELLCPDFALLVIEPQRGGDRKTAFLP